MDNQNWVGIVIALIGGGVGTWILQAIKQHRDGSITLSKSNNDNAIAQNEQAVKIYNVVVDQMRKDVESLDRKYEDLEKMYLASRETNAALKIELETLKNYIKNSCNMAECKIKATLS